MRRQHVLVGRERVKGQPPLQGVLHPLRQHAVWLANQGGDAACAGAMALVGDEIQIKER